jgi:hypothetical protein
MVSKAWLGIVSVQPERSPEFEELFDKSFLLKGPAFNPW